MRPIVTTVVSIFLCMAIVPAGGGNDDPLSLLTADTRIDGGTLRDAFGRWKGTVERDSGGGFVIRDNLGRRLGTITPDGSGGDLVVRDTLGRRTGTLERR